MTQNSLQLTGSLARAARALVGVSAAHVAEQAGLDKAVLRGFEKGHRALTEPQLHDLRRALEQLGATFIADGVNRRGHGVRLKFSAGKAAMVDAWEDEGGHAAEDDV